MRACAFCYDAGDSEGDGSGEGDEVGTGGSKGTGDDSGEAEGLSDTDGAGDAETPGDGEADGLDSGTEVLAPDGATHVPAILTMAPLCILTQ